MPPRLLAVTLISTLVCSAIFPNDLRLLRANDLGKVNTITKAYEAFINHIGGLRKSDGEHTCGKCFMARQNYIHGVNNCPIRGFAMVLHRCAWCLEPHSRPFLYQCSLAPKTTSKNPRLRFGQGCWRCGTGGCHAAKCRVDTFFQSCSWSYFAGKIGWNKYKNSHQSIPSAPWSNF